MKDDSTEIFFRSFLREAIVSSSGLGRDVHSLMLSIQHFLCRPRLCPSYKVPWIRVLERLSRRATCPNHASFRLSTVARRGSCGPTRKLILLRPVVGLMLQVGEADKFPHAFGFECLDPSFRVSKQGPRFTTLEEKRMIRDLYRNYGEKCEKLTFYPFLLL